MYSEIQASYRLDLASLSMKMEMMYRRPMQMERVGVYDFARDSSDSLKSDRGGI